MTMRTVIDSYDMPVVGKRDEVSASIYKDSYDMAVVGKRDEVPTSIYVTATVIEPDLNSACSTTSTIHVEDDTSSSCVLSDIMLKVSFIK